MKHASMPQSIAWFQEKYRSARLVIRPPYQRKPVWSGKQRCALIESILLNIPIPEIYVQVTVMEDGTEEFGVVDGQQRLRTILQFVGIEDAKDQDGEDHNSFSLDELPPYSPFFDLGFSDIKGDRRKDFFSYQICVRFLYTEKIREVEDVFKRLNKYLLPLKPQELRNATYHGAFPKLSEELADDEYWAVNRIVSPAAIRRMADIEMMSDLLIGLIYGPQGGSSKIIDEYYERFEQYEDEFPEQPRIRSIFRKTLELIDFLFPNIGETSRWGNRADFYSLFVALGTILQQEVISSKKYKKLAYELEEFGIAVDASLEKPGAAVRADAKTYARAIEKGSNDRARRLDRHEALMAIIEEFT
jgi:Protein of unknown function DUF262